MNDDKIQMSNINFNGNNKYNETHKRKMTFFLMKA